MITRINLFVSGKKATGFEDEAEDDFVLIQKLNDETWPPQELKLSRSLAKRLADRLSDLIEETGT